MGSIAIVRAYPKIGGINTGVGIAIREGIRALSGVYSREICK